MDPPLEHANLELYLTSASFLILIIYHVRLIYLVRRHPLTTSIGVSGHLRGHWVESVMADKRDILAVQTLRNWVMASSFLASTAILICLGIISVAATPEKMAEITPSLNELVREHRVLWLFKLMMIIVDFFAIFFNFTMAIRSFNQVNFMINVPSTLAHKITPITLRVSSVTPPSITLPACGVTTSGCSWCCGSSGPSGCCWAPSS